jgi:hypothetical protein
MSAPNSSSKRHTRKKRGLLKIASLGIAGLIAGLLSGCSVATTSVALTNYSRVVGNWQIIPASSATPAFAGSLTVNGSKVSGVLHPLNTATVSGHVVSTLLKSQTTCATGNASFPVTGSIDADNQMTLTSSGFTGGTVTVTGTLPSSQNTLNNSTIAIANGACATPTPSVQAVVGKYETLSGTYSGTIYSVSGTSLNVSTIFTQTTSPDANGSYHLQGTSSFGSVQPCLPIPPTVSDSIVTGSTLNATYTETPLGGSPITVVVSGTFSSDAALLTLNSYHIAGGDCDGDSGHGTLSLN